MQNPSQTHPPPPPQPEPFLSRLLHHYKTTPDKVCLTYLLSPSTSISPISRQEYTYKTLLSSALSVYVNILKPLNLQPHAGILLVYPPSVDFIITFIACLLGSYVAIPVFPPDPRSLKKDIEMFVNIQHNCGAKVCVTNKVYGHMKKLGGLKDMFVNIGGKGGKGWPEGLVWKVTDLDVKRDKGFLNSLSEASADELLSSLIPPFNPTSPQPTASSMQDTVPCFLQYTSGSTSLPKGVLITHSNLSHNLHIITQSLKADTSTVVVSWLPQYHDMGLIGSYLGCLYAGGSGVYFSPLHFIQNPVVWIKLISEYKGTHLQGPNFAFKLLNRKFDFKGESAKRGVDRIDLSSVRHIINAAEPVDYSTCSTFIRLFEPYGLNPAVLKPTYGLAENTVFVCSNGVSVVEVDGKGMEDGGSVVVIERRDLADCVASNDDWGGDQHSKSQSRFLLSCGYVNKPEIEDTQVSVLIVDPATREQLSSSSSSSSSSTTKVMVGEIWVRSMSKAAGYFKNDDDSLINFRALLANDENGTNDNNDNNRLTEAAATGYLRTGDLGFISRDELYVCGRLKDLIIVRGRNYYPQDLEATAEAIRIGDNGEVLRGGCCAAVVLDHHENHDSYHDSKEAGVCVIAEVKDVSLFPTPASLAILHDKIYRTILKDHGLKVSYVGLVKPRTIPKTTSGKIARAWCKRAFVEGSLRFVGSGKEGVKVYSDEHDDEHDEEEGFEVMNNTNIDINDNNDNNEDAKSTARTGGPTPSSIRSQSLSQITTNLLSTISKLSHTPSGDIDAKQSLTAMMDSMSLSQLKGMLEYEYCTSVSDGFLFREECCVEELVGVVKVGRGFEDEIDGVNGDEFNTANGDDDGNDVSGERGSDTGRVSRSKKGGEGKRKKNKVKGPAMGPPGLCCSVQ